MTCPVIGLSVSATEVAGNSTGFYLSQRKYALDIITETGLLGSQPALFPLPHNHKLALSKSPLLKDVEPYRRLVDHWEAAVRVVRYLKANPGQGILLKSETDLKLYGWCDSDHASCPNTPCSLTGYFVQLGSSPIAWKTKKQPTVIRSSAEAEYRAMAFLTQELMWLKRLLDDLGVAHPDPMMVYSDSKAAIDIGANPVFHERTKHVGVDCHFIRGEILTKNIANSYVSTRAQLDDIFTKALGKKEFDSFPDKLGIIDLHASA
ncbi:Retrovirus-related Pol polyprotein from transposon RE2 [Cardamine amara subsp. amara]|uniref:Retrovirus-related Pol polyprotein from transposon RE2 n=1 Tax=Cardamine amara subsp. amara TaxID=228776 RepID=A0ABD0ZRK0_CARAN